MYRLREDARNSLVRSLGTFDTLDEAISVKRQAESDLGYHTNHGKIS